MRVLLACAAAVLAGCTEPMVIDTDRKARRPDPSPRSPAPAPKEKPEPAAGAGPRQEKLPPPPFEEKPDTKRSAEAPPRELSVEAVDLSGPDRKTHGVIVFAAERDAAKRALDTHRTHKEEEIGKLPSTAAGSDAGLYLVWGHYPDPTLDPSKVKTAYDAKTGRILVTVPPFTGRLDSKGIGMDWGVDKKDQVKEHWKFVGLRVKLSRLPAGDYTFEVEERYPGRKAPDRVLATGGFTLKESR